MNRGIRDVDWTLRSPEEPFDERLLTVREGSARRPGKVIRWGPFIWRGGVMDWLLIAWWIGIIVLGVVNRLAGWV